MILFQSEKGNILNIVHIIDSSVFGGAERYIIELLRSLNERDNIDVEILTFILNPLLTKEANKYNIKINHINNQNQPSYNLYKNTILSIHHDNPKTIFHTHGYKSNIYTRLALLFKRSSIFTTVHSTLYYWPNRVKRNVYSFLDKITSIKNTKIIAVSDYIKSYYKHILNYKKIVTIYNGVDSDIFNHRVKSSFNKSKPKIITVGNLTSVKNHATLIKAIEILKFKYQIPNISLNILGQGILESELKNKIRELDLINNVHLQGFKENINEYLADSDIYVSTSLEESFGLSIIEAILVGLPVVASRVGGIPEIIEHNKTGLLYDNPKDAEELASTIFLLINDADLFNTLSETALKHASHNYSINKLSNSIYNLYKDTNT